MLPATGSEAWKQQSGSGERGEYCTCTVIMNKKNPNPLPKKAVDRKKNIIFYQAVYFQELSRSSLVHELAVSGGQCLFSVQCSPQVSNDSILNCIKGIAGTGNIKSHTCVHVYVCTY